MVDDEWPVLPDDPDPDPQTSEQQTVDELTRIALDLEQLRPAVRWLKMIALLLAILAVERTAQIVGLIS